MKLSAIRFAGFRGARSLVSLDVASGFVVIVGRNGTGKSTICDAIEYALTGDLRPDSRHTEKGEGILDYIWWRGGGADTPSGRFVELTLIDDDGQEHRIRRTPTEASLPEGLDSLLCHSPQTLERPLSELCRTSILRDEDITRLSVDLKETERFEAVRSALGTADFSTTESRADEVVRLVKREREQFALRYTAANSRITDLAARLSQAKTEVVRADEVASAETTLRTFVPDAPNAPAELASRAERLLSELRVRADALTRLFARLQDREKRVAALQSAERQAEIAKAAEVVRLAQQAAETAERDAAVAAVELAKAQVEGPKNASLAMIREHGERLGLVDGACPLCGTEQDDEHFRAHLRVISDTLSTTNAHLSALTKRSADATARVATAKTEVSRVSAQLSAMRRAEAELKAEFDVLKKEATGFAFDLMDNEAPLDRLAKSIETERTKASHVERAIALLQASRAAEQVSSLELELKGAREELGAVERRYTRAGGALHAATEALDTIRRARGEFVNEQLAQLEPLLVELYQRLRPHVDWPDVHYRLRGDVRQMLRLEVGDGLNPSFVFSSGQRRAAGLAFLLALHLSRSWCSLKTLILDDPVQHIDDYRALHLTEVLAAIRSTKRQVVCTVEDESLGKLLSRRLRSDAESEGLFVRMAYSSRDGIHVASATRVQPMPRNVLVPA